MVQRRRMGFSGLVVGVSVVAMFVITDALDIGGHSAAKQADSLAVASADSDGACAGLRDAGTAGGGSTRDGCRSISAARCGW